MKNALKQRRSTIELSKNFITKNIRAMALITLLTGAGNATIACGNSVPEKVSICTDNNDCEVTRICIGNICFSHINKEAKESRGGQENISDNEFNGEIVNDTSSDEPVKSPDLINNDSTKNELNNEITPKDEGVENAIDENSLDTKDDAGEISEPIADQLGELPDSNEPVTELAPEKIVEAPQEKIVEKIVEVKKEQIPEKTQDASVMTDASNPDTSHRAKIKPGDPGSCCAQNSDCKPLKSGRRVCDHGLCVEEDIIGGTNYGTPIVCTTKKECINKTPASIPEIDLSCSGKRCIRLNGKSCK